MRDVGVRRSVTGFAISAFLLIAGGSTQAVSQEAGTSNLLQEAQQRVDTRPMELNQFRTEPRPQKSTRTKAAKPKAAKAAEKPQAAEEPVKSVETHVVSEPPALPPTAFAPLMAAPGIANANAEMSPPAGVLSPTPMEATAADADDIFGRGAGGSVFDQAPAAHAPTTEVIATPAPPAPVMPVVEADQLNEVDLAGDHSRVDATLASATLESVANDTSSAWSMSSTIGRVFIALGGLLTIISAARLYFA